MNSLLAFFLIWKLMNSIGTNASFSLYDTVIGTMTI
jgi:hypothetical protein